MINLNDLTPAAPAGSTNVLWQEDVSGNVSAYVTVAKEITASNIDALTQGANITTTTLLAITSSGMYRISGYIIVSRAASSSSTLPKLTITWTDPDNNTGQTFDLTSTDAGNLLTTWHAGDFVIDAKTGTNIQYATSGFATSGGTSMQYALHIRIEQM